MAVIYITEADKTQHKFRLPADPSLVVTIGRNEECMVSMPQIVGISGLHCSISLVEGKHIIRDEGSTNGTLDGQRAIGSEPLRAGVTYSIGNASMTYDPELPQVDVPAPKAAPAAASALAGAAALIGLGQERKASSGSALASAAAAIGMKGSEAADVSRVRTEPAPAPGPLAASAKAESPAAAPAKAEEKPAVKLLTKAARPVETAVQPEPQNPVLAVLNGVYVVAMLLLAVYAGLTLRHWLETGTFLPAC